MFVGNPELFVVPASSDRHELILAVGLGDCQPIEVAKDPKGCGEMLDMLELRDKWIRLQPKSDGGKHWNVTEEIEYGANRLKNRASS